MLKINNKVFEREGFSLVEMLAVIAIISILALIVLPNYRAGQQQLALSRSAQKLAADTRMAQEMAMAMKELVGSSIPAGYGIYIDFGNNSWIRDDLNPKCGGIKKGYLLYADINGDQQYTPADANNGGKLEVICLEKGVIIKELQNTTSGYRERVGINFKPPDPTINIHELGGGQTELKIILALENYPLKTKTVIVNKAGLIAVEQP